MSRALTITGVAAAVFAGFFLIPPRPRLTHMDFIAGGAAALEFCDAANPRFLPVVARDAPVTAALSGAGPCLADQETSLALELRTNTGKAIGPGDLAQTGGRKLNLYAIDPSLTDFQVLEAQPGAGGTWHVRFTPRAGGAYRVFADFTPEATGQEMYLAADLAVRGPPAPQIPAGPSFTAEAGGWRFRLSSAPAPVRIREPAVLTLEIAQPDGGAGAPDRTAGRGPELIAFDQTRSGMVDLRLGPGGSGRVSFPDSGRYVVWAHLRAAGQDRSVPFSVVVEP